MHEDRFLYDSRPPVRQVFADGLYHSLSKRYPDESVNQTEEIPMERSIQRFFTWKYAVLVLCAAAILIATFSEPVRAKALEVIKMIAGFNVEEQSESPFKGLVGEGEISGTETVSAVLPLQAETPLPTPTSPEVTVYSIPTVSVIEALNNPPFSFGLPVWVPEGFELDANVGIANSGDWVSLVWEHPDGREIQMLVEREYSGYTLPAGEDSSEEIEINGKPALLVRGFWDAEHQWDPQRQIVIGWMQDERFYRLSYTNRLPSTKSMAPIEGDLEPIIANLVRMAESIP